MNPLVRVLCYSLLALLGLVFIVISTVYVKINLLIDLQLSIFFIILGVLGTLIFNWAIKKVYFFWKFKNTVNKLEGQSLYLLATKRGLSFTSLNLLSAEAIRYLIDLGLIKVVVFPETLNYIYSMTRLGRVLLEKLLKYPLYPENFCSMLLVRFWEGYPKEFIKEKRRFENDCRIPWEKCCEIFREQFRKKGLPVQEDIYQMFEKYYRDKQENP